VLIWKVIRYVQYNVTFVTTHWNSWSVKCSFI